MSFYANGFVWYCSNYYGEYLAQFKLFLNAQHNLETSVLRMIGEL